MERRIRERLIGASVLVMLAVIFIPMMLDNSGQVEQAITETNIPPRPEDSFTSRIVPLPEKQKKATGITNGEDLTAIAPQPAAPEAAGAQEPVAEPPAMPVAEALPAQAKVETPAEATPQERVGMKAWVVQLGSFSSEVNAKALVDSARKSGFSAFVEPLGGEKGTSWRVRVGPELRRSDALALRDRLKTVLGVEGMVINYP